MTVWEVALTLVLMDTYITRTLLYSLIVKLTAFFQLQEFSLRNPTNSTIFAARRSPRVQKQRKKIMVLGKNV
jgi:hypothetical protein